MGPGRLAVDGEVALLPPGVSAEPTSLPLTGSEARRREAGAQTWTRADAAGDIGDTHPIEGSGTSSAPATDPILGLLSEISVFVF